MRNLLRPLSICALLLVAIFIAASSADAQIIQLSNNQGQGGCSSSGTGPGGTLCVGPNTPYLLSDIDDGAEVLTIPNTSSTPTWYVENDTGSAVTSVSLIFDGTLASNANLQCNFGGGESGTCKVDGVTNGLNNPIPIGDIPANITFSLTGSIANDSYFEINTASFAAAGQDYGCLSGVAVAPGSTSGTTSCSPTGVPESGTLTDLAFAGLLFGTWLALRRIRPLGV